MKIIESKIIGILSQNDRFEDWWQSEPIIIPLVYEKLCVIFMGFEPDLDEKFIKEADKAMESFLQLDTEYKNQITNYVYNHFLKFKSLVGLEDIPIEMNEIQESEIWNYITPSEILITRRPYNEPDIFINMTCECLWEQEHGLQLVFKKGKALTRVSGQDGHLSTADAYGIPDSEDRLLANFKE